MAKITGVVTAIYDKKFDDGGEARSIKIEGSPLYFRLGKRKFEGIVAKGNTVELFYEQTDDKAAKVTSDVTLAKKAQAVETTAAATGGAAKTYGNQSSGDDRNASIVYQSSRKDALVFVDFLLRNSAVVIPAKQTSKVAFLEALLDKYTASFVADVASGGAVTRAVPPTVEKPTQKAEAGDESEGEEE